MKNFILAGICILLTSFCFSQEWSNEQLELLDKYGLEKTDHRGLVLSTNSADCENSSSIEDVLLKFFTSDVRKDITTLCISSDKENISGQILDLYEITSLYIKITEQKSK